jgi:hypothetical protein
MCAEIDVPIEELLAVAPTSAKLPPRSPGGGETEEMRLGPQPLQRGRSALLSGLRVSHFVHRRPQGIIALALAFALAFALVPAPILVLVFVSVLAPVSVPAPLPSSTALDPQLSAPTGQSLALSKALLADLDERISDHGEVGDAIDTLDLVGKDLIECFVLGALTIR